MLIHNKIANKTIPAMYASGQLPVTAFVDGGTYGPQCNCVEDWSCSAPVIAGKPYMFDDVEPAETLFYAAQPTGPSSRFYSYRSIMKDVAINVPLITACDQQLAQELEPLGNARQLLLGNADRPAMYASIDSVVSRLQARNPDPVPSSCTYLNGTRGVQAGDGIICELGVTASQLRLALRNEARQRRAFAPPNDPPCAVFMFSACAHRIFHNNKNR